MSDTIIQTKALTMYYGKNRGIIDVDLTVKKGEVYGFLGPNGAGKTTTQRILLDIIRPSSGTATIFGMDCQKDGDKIRKRIGYLPGDLSLYQEMKASDFLDVIASLYGGIKYRDYRQELCERFNLDVSRKIKQFSRGNKQKVGIVAAFMHKPELLILDEPTSGLDPLNQQVLLQLVKEAKSEERTVFFSSHVLHEVQQVCDWAGIIREGKLIKTESIEALMQQQYKRIKITIAGNIPEDAFQIEGVQEVERNGNQVFLEVTSNLDQLMKKAASIGIGDIETVPVSLEEVFMAYYGQGNGEE